MRFTVPLPKSRSRVAACSSPILIASPTSKLKVRTAEIFQKSNQTADTDGLHNRHSPKTSFAIGGVKKEITTEKPAADRK